MPLLATDNPPISDSFPTFPPTPTIVQASPLAIVQTTQIARYPCGGIQWLGPQPIRDFYPWRIDAVGSGVTWSASTDGTLRSKSCTLLSEFESCDSCELLRKNVKLLDVVRRAQNSNIHLTTVNDSYLTIILIISVCNSQWVGFICCKRR